MSFLNPYTLIGGGVGVLAIAGSFYVQSTLIHKYHVLYDTDEKTIVELQTKIKGMTDTQNNQTGKSEANVIKVVQGQREVQTIIREINTAKSKGPCLPPEDSEEVKNAF